MFISRIIKKFDLSYFLYLKMNENFFDYIDYFNAANTGDLDTLIYILENSSINADCEDGYALILAAKNGHIKIVEFLLYYEENAPKANCQNDLALLWASFNGYSDIIKCLIEQKKYASLPNCREGTAIIAAAYNGHADVLNLLLKYPNIKFTEKSIIKAISTAITEEKQEIINILSNYCKNL
jgi:ankyrin repeat protein